MFVAIMATLLLAVVCSVGIMLFCASVFAGVSDFPEVWTIGFGLLMFVLVWVVIVGNGEFERVARENRHTPREDHSTHLPGHGRWGN